MPRCSLHHAPALRSWIAAVSLTILMSSGCLSALLRAAPPAAETVEVLPDLAEIKAALEEIRGLEFLREVPAEKQSLDDFGAYLQTELDRMFPPGKAEDLQAGLMRLGLILEPMDLGVEFKNALLSQAGAYYDPESGTFYYLMTGMAEQFLQTIAAHELVHALQDQHYQLGPLMERLDKEYSKGTRNDDAVLAVRFLVEGEATYVQTLWQTRALMGMDLASNPAMERMAIKGQADMELSTIVALSKQMVAAMGGDDAAGDIIRAIEGMDAIPPYIMHPLLAAYLKGAYFVMAGRHHGGWEAVAGIYEDLPRSTEQTLHPEKYFVQRDNPTILTLPPMAYLEEHGWGQIDAAIHGEFYLSLLLRNHGAAPTVANRAAAGWDGDVYHAYRHEDGRVMIVLATTWDSERDADQFFKAYRDIIAAKYNLPADEVFDDRDESAEAADLAYRCSDDPSDRGRLIRSGREVFVIEGVSAELAQRIADDLRAMPVDHVD